jgi:hypothetical protein
MGGKMGEAPRREGESGLRLIFSLYFQLSFPLGFMCASTHLHNGHRCFWTLSDPLITLTRTKRGLGRRGITHKTKAREFRMNQGNYMRIAP